MRSPLLTLPFLVLAATAHAQDDPFAVMKHADAGVAKRSPAEVRAKYATMRADAYSYYRGSAPVFYRDAKGLPKDLVGSDDVTVWLSGDLHLGNVGVVTLADKSLAFDLNDVDEGAKGSYLLDLDRLATSILLAGGDEKQVEAMARAYYDAMKDVESGALTADFRWTVDNARGPIKNALVKGARATRNDLIDPITETTAGKPSFKPSDEIHPLTGKERDAVAASLDAYVKSIPKELRKDADYYTPLDIARSTGHGTGSRGLDRYWVLIRGKSGDPADTRLLEIKEERASAVTAVTGETYADDGERVVKAANALIGQPDRFLGNTRIAGRSFVVREVSPNKKGVDLSKKIAPDDMERFVVDVARLVARSHAFSADHPKQKARAILGRMKDADTFAKRLLGIANDEAKKTRADFETFKTESLKDVVTSRAVDKDADKTRASEGINRILEREVEKTKDRAR